MRLFCIIYRKRFQRGVAFSVSQFTPVAVPDSGFRIPDSGFWILDFLLFHTPRRDWGGGGGGGQRLGKFLCQNHPTESDVTSG